MLNFYLKNKTKTYLKTFKILTIYIYYTLYYMNLYKFCVIFSVLFLYKYTFYFGSFTLLKGCTKSVCVFFL